jgi:hypothetical protein
VRGGSHEARFPHAYREAQKLALREDISVMPGKDARLNITATSMDVVEYGRIVIGLLLGMRGRCVRYPTHPRAGIGGTSTCECAGGSFLLAGRRVLLRVATVNGHVRE